MPDNLMLDAALEYAAKGLYVHPLHSPRNGHCSCGAACGKPGKHPRTAHGFRDASIDPAQIKAWWTAWPDANIGIAGEQSHLQMIDIDPRDGGAKTWARIIQGRELLCPTVQSGGEDEGLHFYLKDNRELKDLGPGIQVKYRGYVVAPPSLHASGRRYAWIKPLNGMLPEVPAWLDKAPILIPQTDSVKQAAETIINRWLDRAMLAPPGERNITLNKAAYTLGGILHLGAAENDILQMLREAGAKCGLPSGEVEKLIQRSIADGKRKPIALDVALEAPVIEHINFEDGVEVRSRFRVYTAKDALAPQPPVEWVIEKLLTPGSVSALAGSPGSKKTYALLDAAVCVALGKPWIGLSTKGGPVLIVDEESGKRRLARRLGAVLIGHEADATTPIFYTSLERLNLRLASEEIALENLIVTLGAKLVIVDALVDVMPGGDENSVKDIQPIFSSLRSIAEHTQAAIVIIHHWGKSGNYRGSSAISGAVDLMLNIESKHDSMTIDFSFEKARDAEPFKFSATANFDDGRFWLDARETQMGNLRLGKAQRYVLRFLDTHGASTVDTIMSGADTCAPNGARMAVYSLADLGFVHRTNAGESGDAVYELTIKGKHEAG